MASIDKLQVRGIRAFSPQRDETIEFYSPLTMIVGANGCGKTTIIECLKMACTGALPPSVSQGQSFVNDPSMTNASEVKAHIKLRFNNKSGQPTVVARLFQVTRKKTKLEFKRLDGTVRTTDADGVKQSITQKCSDLDKHVPELLGVTSAVMENVVFCHQEESCWPLQDSSVLKKKFDDIFDSARYTKALDAIKQSKKEYKNRSNDLKVDVSGLGAHLQAAKSLRQDLENSEEKEDICRRESESLSDKLQQIDSSLGEYQIMLSGVHDLEEELRELRWKSEEIERRVSEKRDNLEQVFSESDEELKQQLDSFEEEMTGKVSELEEMKSELRDLHRSVSDHRSSLSVISARRGEAFSLRQQSEAQASSLIAMMKDISQRLLLTDYSGDLDPDISASEVVKYAKSFVDALQDALRAKQRDSKKAISDAQVVVDKEYASHMEASRNSQKTSIEISNTETELKKIEGEKAQAKRELNKSSSGRSGSVNQQKAQLIRELELCKNEYEEFMQSLNKQTEKNSKEKRSSESRLQELTSLIDENAQVLREMSVNRADAERIEAQENQIKADEYACENEVKSIISKYRSHILKCLQSSPSTSAIDDVPCVQSHGELESLWTSLQRYLTTTKNSAKSVREEHDKIKDEVTRGKAAVNQDERRRAELEKMIEKKYRTCEDDLRACMGDLSTLLADEDDIDVDEKIREDIERLRAGSNFYQALTEFHKDSQLPLDSSRLSGTSSTTPSSSATSSQPTQKDNPEDTVQEFLRLLMQDYSETGMAFKSAKIWKEKLLKKSKKRSKGRTGGPKCPCCDRGMNEEEMSVFEKNLKDIFEKADNDALEARSKQNADKAREIVKQFTASCQQAKALISCRTELAVINRRLDDSRSNISQLSRDEQKKRMENEEADESIRVTEKCVFELGSYLNTWTNIATRMDEVQTKKRRYRETIPDVTSNGRGRSIRQIEEEQRQYIEEKEHLQSKKEKILEEENRLTRQQHTLKDNVYNKEQELSEINRREGEMKEYEVKLEQLRTSELSVDERLRNQKRQKITNDRTLKVCEEQERAARLELKQVEEKFAAEMRVIEDHKASVEHLQRSLLDIQRQSQSADLDAVDAQLEKTKKTIAEQEKRIESLTPTVQRLTNQVTQQEHTKRIVLDNVSLRQAERERDETLASLQNLEETVNAHMHGKGSIKEVQRKMQRLEQEKAKVEKQCHNLQGQLSAHKEHLRDIQDKLKGPSYRNIDERYRVKNIEYETTVMAVTDLDSYHIALDNALQRFHTLRIADINKIIKDMWQLIYRGEDIDMIEIVSGAEDSAGGNRASRSYNYRVMMRKGNVPLDMRGRCSAGQRVMASIVIRLALAETLCLDCGMLCLDEPTTNLDDANKQGLAYALSRIIASRSSQQNFQLICITHDEDFVRMISEQLGTLADFRLPEYYFRISRQEDGYDNEDSGEGPSKYFSHIEKIPWDDML